MNGRQNIHGDGAQAFHLPDAAPLAKPRCGVFSQGDVITAKGLHWSRSHDAANWLRNYAANVLDDIAAIDADKRLSPIGRAERKKQLAAKAKATIEKSKAIGTRTP